MATKEKALKEKEGKKPSSKTNNTVNGTGGTPIHVNTLQVNTKLHLLVGHAQNSGKLFGSETALKS